MAYPFWAIRSPILFDHLSLPALGFAKSIAKDQGATLHLHVVGMPSALGEPAINATLHSRAEKRVIEVLNAPDRSWRARGISGDSLKSAKTDGLNGGGKWIRTAGTGF
jgi:hypothetical protein